VNNFIPDNPFTGVPAPRFPRKLSRVYTEEQLRSVLKYVARRPRERAIVQLFLDSGIRLAELAGIRIGDVDIEHGSVFVV
jgi:integrase/recombinase XerC